MASFLKMTAFLNHPLAGREETYYLKTNSETDAMKVIQDYVVYRRCLMATDVRIVGISLTRTGQPPNSYCVPLAFPIFRPLALGAPVARLPGAPGLGILPDGDEVEVDGVNTVFATMSVRFMSSNPADGGHNGTRQIPFIPDAWVNAQKFTFAVTPNPITAAAAVPGAPTLAAPAAVYNFLSWILTNCGNVQLPFSPKYITAVSNTANSIITTATPHGITVGTTPSVNINGVLGAVAINGRHKVVTVLSPFSFTIDNDLAPGAYTSGGRISAWIADGTLYGWDSACVIRPASKRVGRPSGPFRGRRRRLPARLR